MTALETRLAIQDVMTRYAAGVDDRNMEQYRSCFADDVEIVGFGGDAVVGADRWVAEVVEKLAAFGQTQHMLGPQLVQVDGDGASVRTDVQALHYLIDDPESTIVDFAHLRTSSSELSTFRRETQELVAYILQHKEEIDASLASVIENYAPQRVDPVDRAILRLATYELRMADDIPRAVTINEAIEIAKKFGTNESARFINGVLDAL